jgi:hypothetical protein
MTDHLPVDSGVRLNLTGFPSDQRIDQNPSTLDRDESHPESIDRND